MKKTVKVEGSVELQIKRFYLPIDLKVNCPHCGVDMVIELDSADYLSYPIVNGKEEIAGCCDHCDNEYEIDVTLKIEVEYEPEKIRKI